MSLSFDQMKKERALIFALQTAEQSDEQVEAGLAELRRLAETAGLEVGPSVVQKRAKADPAYFLGRGKLLEVAELARLNDCDLLLADAELSGSVQRRIAETCELKTLDRTLLILDIFAQHAVTAEGQLQVRLAQLQDRLTRLHAHPGALSRLGGGIGTRGPGESQLETDRRHLRRQIHQLKQDLRQLARQAEQQRRRRLSLGLQTVAVLGYTNAGKSTLMNALCESDLLVCDQLFATLDARARRLQGNGSAVLLVDTVGFIRKLPSHLVAAFRSTLDEIRAADLLLAVVDAADPDWSEHLALIQSTLAEMDLASRPVLLVFNQIDRIGDTTIEARQTLAAKQCGWPCLRLSAFDAKAVEELRQKIRQMLADMLLPIKVEMSYRCYQQLGAVWARSFCEDEQFHAERVQLRYKVHPADWALICRTLASEGVEVE